MKQGIIASHFGMMVLIEGQNGERVLKRVKRKSGLVVGDIVCYDEQIHSQVARKNVLARQTDFGIQEMAANVDLLGIVVAPFPKTPETFIDLAIMAARPQGIKPFILVNKADLPQHAEYLSIVQKTYEPLIPVLSASTNNKSGIEELKALVNNNGRTLLIGVSGAGKSSLVNILVPDAHLDVGEHVPEQSHGKHVTTVSTMHHVQGGGFLIDAPGVRDFRIAAIEPKDRALYFVGFEKYLATPCRFRNCLHDHEPGCNIREALLRGEIDDSRYKLYIQMLKES